MSKPTKSKAKSKVKAHVGAVVKSAATYLWVNKDRPLIKPVHELLKGKERFDLDDVTKAIGTAKSTRTPGNVVNVWTRYGLIKATNHSPR